MISIIFILIDKEKVKKKERKKKWKSSSQLDVVFHGDLVPPYVEIEVREELGSRDSHGGRLSGSLIFDVELVLIAVEVQLNHIAGLPVTRHLAS